MLQGMKAQFLVTYRVSYNFFSIYEVAISPDGARVLATAGNMILVSSSRSIAQTSNFSDLNVCFWVKSFYSILIFVKVYDSQNGSMVDMLKGHKSTVYCINYASDGKNIGWAEFSI